MAIHAGYRRVPLPQREETTVNASKEAKTAESEAREPDFEAALEELEALVERMEGGELSLDDSLAAFERGIHLTRRCQQALTAAEQRIQTLLEREDGSLTTEPLPAQNEDDGS